MKEHNLIFLGAPGAGKGTVSKQVLAKYPLAHISTGDLLRAEVAAGTELGKKADALMKSGQLVPDEVVIGIIEERLQNDDCKAGFILDGFPRTIPQAEALDTMGVIIDRVISIEVADEDIARRMSGRRVCKGCGSSYHLEYKKPAVEGICNACGGELIQRKDDHPDTVLDRLKVYHEQTEPLKGYYEKKGILRIVEGQEEVADTTALTLKALED